MGVTQTPLTEDLALTDTQHFLMGVTQTSLTDQLGLHRFPSLIIGLTQIPNHSLMGVTQTPFTDHLGSHRWGSYRHPSLITGLTQLRTFSHGVQTDILTDHGAHTDTQHFLLGVTQMPLTYDWARSNRYPHFSHGGHTDVPLTNHWAHTDTHPFSCGSHRSLGSHRYLHFLMGATPASDAPP